jgi:hypothetical protein
MLTNPAFIAFAGTRRIAAGALPQVAHDLRVHLDTGALDPVAVFDAVTSSPVDLDLRGTPEEAAERAEQMLAQKQRPQPKTGPGRPKLGVVAREVTLLPRHWDWLNAQPGGASVTLRKLVETARKQNQESDNIRRTQDVTYRFMSAVGGDLPGFEEATRALYAWDLDRLEEQIRAWPEDVRDHVLSLANQG